MRASLRFFSLSSTMRTSSFAMHALRRLHGRIGNEDGEGRALADLARKRDAPPVQLDELAGEREPEAGALGLARVVLAHLPEFLEHRLAILRRDAHAGVRDRDLGSARYLARNHPHRAALRRELDRVGKE